MILSSTKFLCGILLILTASLLMAQAPNFNWSRTAGGTARDQGDAVAVDLAGNVFVAGEYFSSTIDFGDGVSMNIGAVSTGNCDFFLTKYNPTGQAIWAVRGGGTLTDRGYGVVVDKFGDLLVTGHYFGTATFDSVTRTSSGNLDMFVAKYDTTGKLQWFSEGKSVSQVSSRSIATDNLGNAYIVGYFGSSTAPVVNFGALSLTSSGQREAYLVKFNSAGEPLWCVSGGGPKSGEEAKDVVIDEAGNVYITGAFVDTASFSGVTLNGNGSNEIFIAKYNSEGQLSWVKSAGGAKADEGNSIALDGKGFLYISGKVDSAATFELTEVITAGAADAYIAKYDTAGNFVWVLTGGGSGSDYCYDVSFDHSGNIIGAGGFSATANFGSEILTSAGNEDLFFMKVDPLKNILWIKQAGGPELDRIGGIALDIGDNIITTGYYSTWIKIGSDSLVSNGAQEVFVSKLGNNPIPVELTSFTAEYSNSEVILKWTTASELNNAGFDIERSTDNEEFSKIVFLIGFGTTTEIHQYSYSDNNISASTYYYRLRQLDYDGTFTYSKVVEIDADLPMEFELHQNYPNPFNPLTTIDFALPVDANVNLSIYNSIGEHVRDIINAFYSAGNYKINFDASTFASGIYLYRLNAVKLNGTFLSNTKKLTIMK